MNHLRQAIFDRIGDRIEDAPRDGINAEGDYSENVAAEQRAFIAGMRSARLAAIKMIDDFQNT